MASQSQEYCQHEFVFDELFLLILWQHTAERQLNIFRFSLSNLVTFLSLSFFLDLLTFLVLTPSNSKSESSDSNSASCSGAEKSSSYIVSHCLKQIIIEKNFLFVHFLPFHYCCDYFHCCPHYLLLSSQPLYLAIWTLS